MISHGAWQRLFGGRPDVIGQRIEFTGAGDNDVYRILGVMPEGFSFGGAVDLWRPVLLVELPIRQTLRSWRYDGMIARLRPGRTIEASRAELTAICETLARDYPRSNAGWTVTVESLHASVIGDFGRATWMLLACVAVGPDRDVSQCGRPADRPRGRAAARDRRSPRTRASSWRLLRLSLCEARCSASVAARPGFCWHGWESPDCERRPRPASRAWTPSRSMRRPWPLRPSRRCSACSSSPRHRPGALGATSVRVYGHLLDTGGRQPFPAGALAVAQCAGATTLVVLALLLTRSFHQLMAVELGWSPDHVLSMSIIPKLPPDLRRRPWYRYVQWSDELMARLEATPGIEAPRSRPRCPCRHPSRRRSRRAAARRHSTWHGGRACSTTSAMATFS